MSLPASSDLYTLAYAFQGQPFVNVVGNATVDTTTLAYAHIGSPFVGIGGSGTGGGSGTTQPLTLIIAT
jgi:hypothetical protein